jgi:peroxin-2
MREQASMKTRFEPELALLVELVLYRFSVWSSGASYGAMLQGLRYSVPSSGLGCEQTFLMQVFDV